VPGALILGRQLRSVARARFATKEEAKP